MSGAPTEQDRSRAREWLAATFRPGAPFDPAGLPLSFRYDGRESAAFLGRWRAAWGPGADGDGHVLTLTDPDSGLRLTCEVTAFADYPAVEWVAYLENTGDRTTPIVADLQALDAVVRSDSPREACWVQQAKGSQCQLDDFEPLRTQLSPRGELRLAARKGRSSDGALPFFNLELGGGGVVGAIGWTGGWAASFERGADGHLRARAGLASTHLALRPGARIRTPRVLLLFWEGDRLHGHNLLRRFLLAHHTPRPNGARLRAPVRDAHWGAAPP